MNWNEHSDLEGQHALLSASKYHWINYDDDKLTDYYKKYRAAQIGTKYHELAKSLIEMGVHLPKTKQTFNLYVNDAIKYNMKSEQVLYYSENAFGTADAISFHDNLLRIHDLKSGVTKASMHQLEIYEALFCLEYKVDPLDINSELRIYQTKEVVIANPPAEEIKRLMSIIIEFDKKIDKLKMEETL